MGKIIYQWVMMGLPLGAFRNHGVKRLWVALKGIIHSSRMTMTTGDPPFQESPTIMGLFGDMLEIVFQLRYD